MNAGRTRSVPDLVRVRLPRGSRLLVAGDLHLPAVATPASEWATRELERRIDAWSGPGAVVLAGDAFELLGAREEGAVAAALDAHASFAGALREFADGPGRAVVCLCGNHDGRLAWDADAAASVRATLACRIGLAARIEVVTDGGVKAFLVQHGHQLDPANAFADPRSPNDTPLGHHVVTELIPALRDLPGPWLEDASALADPLAFPDFAASRLVYRRMLRRPWRLALVAAALALLASPLTSGLLRRLGHPLPSGALAERVLLLALVAAAVLALAGGVMLGGARRIWSAVGERLVSRRDLAANQSPRQLAGILAAQGYAGLITAHTHRSELSAAGPGFYANVGSGTVTVAARPGRLGLPPVFLPVLRLSWVEVDTSAGIRVRLFRSGRETGSGTWLERAVARRHRVGRAVEVSELVVPSGPRVRTQATTRVLVLSARVGEGHEASARGLAEDVRRRWPNARVRIVDGLRAVSPALERFIVDSYRFQLRRAPWSYEWLYRAIVASPRLAGFLYRLCGLVGGRKIRRLVEDADPDVVVSTYPLTSAMLAWLRERGRMPVPCVNVVTDLAPHPMWTFEHLDANLVMHSATVDRVHELIGTPPLEVVAPPVAARFLAPSRRAEARAALGIPPEAFVVLVVGGGWGVGQLGPVARAASSVEGAWTIVVCGRNEALRRALAADPPPRTIVLGFVDTMPDLMDAADVMVHNAGGLTCLEAFVRGCPVLVTQPIPGHGIACAELMEQVGAVRYVRAPASLPAELRACAADAGLRERAGGLREALVAAPTAAACLASLVERARVRAADALEPARAAVPDAARAAPGHRRRWAVAAAGTAAAASVMFLTSGMSVSLAAGRVAIPAVRTAGSAGSSEIGLSVVSADPAVLTATAGLLSAGGARATFFMPAAALAGRPSWLGGVLAAGELGNGGLGNRIHRLSGVGRFRRDVVEGQAEVGSVAGRPPVFYLPVAGPLTPAACLAASRQSEVAVVGSRHVRAGAGLRRPLRPGDVVVLDLRRSTPARARDLVRSLLAQASSRNLQVADLSEVRAWAI